MTKEGQVVARLRDDRHEPAVRLLHRDDFMKVVADCKNPPKPSAALVGMFSKAKPKATSTKA